MFPSIFSNRILEAEDLESQDGTFGEIEARIRAQWEEFVARDVPALIAPIQEAARSMPVLWANGETTR
jgi:hypothetical protein